MKKKVISALLCAAMVATMLVGCGGSSNDSKSSGGDGKKLVYWAMWSKDEPQAKVIQDAIAKYTEDTGVEVDVQFKGRSGQREGLQPALDAKQTIDLFDEDVNRVNGSWGKYLLDLEDVAKDYESEHGNETLSKLHVQHMRMEHFIQSHISHQSSDSFTIRHYLIKLVSKKFLQHGMS